MTCIRYSESVQPAENIAVRVTEGLSLESGQSTITVHHPQVKYFVV